MQPEIYATLYLMIHSKDFFKHWPSITGFSIMEDYFISQKMTESFSIKSQSPYQSPHLLNFYCVPKKS